MGKDIYTLAIETSCDETSCAIMKNGREIITNQIYSQIDIHKKFGGVVPEVASRNHVRKISLIVQDALDESNMKFKDIDNIAVTYGPGLVGALLVGMSYAKSLAFALDKPLIPVNHIEGHIFANFIEFKELEPPFLCLVVSGGHTHLIHMEDYGKYEILGKTRDDAAGEAFDKVARTMGLGYPGGPLIDKLAKKGDKNSIDFPRAFLEKDSLDFSFSGLKSAVLNYINNNKQKKVEINVENVSASFQEAVVDVLVTKTIQAAKLKNCDKIIIAGGVAANSGLRAKFEENLKATDIKVMYPSLRLCTDNAAMIGCAGYYQSLRGHYGDEYLNAVPNLKLGEYYEGRSS
jgi:N6-L-threonylcarbamoyladenine synthase